MLLLTDEQLYSAAYALAGYEKWLKKKHGIELKPAARRKTVKQLLTSAKLKFKNADVASIVEHAANMSPAAVRISTKLAAVYEKMKRSPPNT